MIEVNNLTKKFGLHTAVNNISFNINKGEVVGFLGPNGAGKTTTMNMMTGYISSTEGSVKINGYDILEEPEKAKQNLGYLPDTPPLYADMTVNEYLDFVCRLKKVKKSEIKSMILEILKTTGLSEVSKRLVGNLSKGYRQRVGLAQALIGNPEVLILDEPTVGLDPKQIIEMRSLIKSLGKEHTVILSSHILSEVNQICDRVIIINNGEIVADDTTKNINAEGVKNVVLVTIKGDSLRAIEAIKRLDIIKDVTVEKINDDGTCDLKITGEENTDIREAVFAILAVNKISVLMLKPYSLSLEDVFLKVITGEMESEKKL
ncbi:MAG: ABC transporter ATP-binding protein [Lachnospirales bacterium]